VQTLTGTLAPATPPVAPRPDLVGLTYKNSIIEIPRGSGGLAPGRPESNSASTTHAVDYAQALACTTKALFPIKRSPARILRLSQPMLL
jgi:hypothetical protein